MASRTIPDGLEALRAELKLGEIMRLIERTARWVDPETFHLLPVWYPEYARRAYFYKADWSEPQMNTNKQSGHTEHKREGNRYANIALTHALGLRSPDRPGWSCCHIWGVDDPLYQQTNAVVQDRRFFSCIGNMVLLPTPLKAFTDAMPEVKAMLRVCAHGLYGWQYDPAGMVAAVSAVEKQAGWDVYPASWPRPDKASSALGVMPINDGIRKSAAACRARIRRDLDHAGSHYPREEVRAALAYWHIEI